MSELNNSAFYETWLGTQRRRAFTAFWAATPVSRQQLLLAVLLLLLFLGLDLVGALRLLFGCLVDEEKRLCLLAVTC